ncbi:S41 family peptidase [Flavobacterium sp. Arc2]|uniref:S41 family peptidase n=1 Tax=Flavobacterium sp. Arc2 TaxID=3046685 RepID=UPI00352DA87E
MRKIILFVFILLFFVQCSSVKKHNNHLMALIPVDQLKSDVDFTYTKLKNLHPNLYWYISKSALDFKFDSIKSTITQPITPLAFYKKLSPVVAAVRQGHTYLYPASKRMTKKETKALVKKGIGPFSQFDFDFFDNKLYVVNNKSYDKKIQLGSEVIAVNGTKPLDLIQEYNRYYSSDGYNTTLKTATSGKRFTSYFTVENGIKDSLTYTLKYNDSVQFITIRRYKEDSIKKQEPKVRKRVSSLDRAKSRETRRKKRVNGYNPDLKNYNRNLHFMEKDSSVAIMKIRSFNKGDFRPFYKESFRKIDNYKSKTLILDLRDNGGGRLNEIVDLYSYLADSTFVFLDKSEVVSRSSLMKGAYFNGGSFGLKVLKAIYAPLLYSYLLLTVHKDDTGKNWCATHTRDHKLNANRFQGRIYVLINGGSFSASSLISSNLKSSKRVTFVGDETGGAFNGTVAGFTPVLKLPNSKLKIRIGIMMMAPHHKTKIKGHGIFPDKEISSTLEDRLKENDPELNWILKDIKKEFLKSDSQ